MWLRVWDLSYVDMGSSPIIGALEYEVPFLAEVERERWFRKIGGRESIVSFPPIVARYEI